MSRDLFVEEYPTGARGVTRIMQVRRLARKVLDTVTPGVRVKLFIILLKVNFISTFARAACRNRSNRGFGWRAHEDVRGDLVIRVSDLCSAYIMRTAFAEGFSKETVNFGSGFSETFAD
jgi:hypothetical protein